MRMAVPKATIDLTGPTDCSVGTVDDRDRIVARLGPDPLRDDADAEAVYRRVSRRVAPIGQLLLEQHVISGIGNVYRAEALFVTGLHPLRPGTDISRADFDALWRTIVAMLRRGVEDNRIVTVDRDEFAVPNDPKRRGETTYVYHRDVCLRCGTPILTVELGGRACYYCPTCQPR
jgi:endonuclease-8